MKSFCKKMIKPVLIVSVGFILCCYDSGSKNSLVQAEKRDESELIPISISKCIENKNFSELADTSIPRLLSLSDNSRRELLEHLETLSIPERVAVLIFLQVGTPYKTGPLGEDIEPDTDPVFSLKFADCTVMILIAESLAHAIEYRGETRAMQFANYRVGDISYENRFHFTTDRLDSSPFDRDITKLIAPEFVKTVSVNLNEKLNGEKWISINWSRKRIINYIPFSKTEDAKNWFESGRLPEAVGVGFLKKKFMENGLDLLHEGFLWKGEILVHASSRAGRVVSVNWRDFIKERGGLYDGVIFYEFL